LLLSWWYFSPSVLALHILILDEPTKMDVTMIERPAVIIATDIPVDNGDLIVIKNLPDKATKAYGLTAKHANHSSGL
jgi:hypothetical protein